MTLSEADEHDGEMMYFAAFAASVLLSSADVNLDNVE